MSTGWIVTIVILVILIAVAVALYFFGKKAQKKQEEQQAQIEAAAQTVQMLVIDKKKMRLNEAGWKTIPFYDCFALHLVHLPKKKNKLPEWYYRDRNSFNTKYPYKTDGDTIINNEKPKIKASAFWKYSFKNVIIGYILRFRDKRHKK